MIQYVMLGFIRSAKIRLLEISVKLYIFVYGVYVFATVLPNVEDYSCYTLMVILAPK